MSFVEAGRNLGEPVMGQLLGGRLGEGRGGATGQFYVDAWVALLTFVYQRAGYAPFKAPTCHVPPAHPTTYSPDLDAGRVCAVRNCLDKSAVAGHWTSHAWPKLLLGSLFCLLGTCWEPDAATGQHAGRLRALCIFLNF